MHELSVSGILLRLLTVHLIKMAAVAIVRQMQKWSQSFAQPSRWTARVRTLYQLCLRGIVL